MKMNVQTLSSIMRTSFFGFFGYRYARLNSQLRLLRLFLDLDLALFSIPVPWFPQNYTVNSEMFTRTKFLLIYVACPKSPVTNAFYSDHITGTNQSFTCRIIGHSGTYFTVKYVTHINDLAATVTLVTMSRHDRRKSNYAKCFLSFHFSQTA